MRAFAGNKFARAFELANNAFVLLTQVTTPAHPCLAKCYNIIGTILARSGDMTAALTQNIRALSLWNHYGALDSADALQTSINIAEILSATGRREEAINMYQRAIYLMNLLGSVRQSHCYAAYVSISSLYRESLQLELASSCIGEAKKLCFNNHINYSHCNHLMSEICALNANRLKEALKYEKAAYAGYSAVLGEEHALSQESLNRVAECTKLAVAQARLLMNAKSKSNFGNCAISYRTLFKRII